MNGLWVPPNPPKQDMTAGYDNMNYIYIHNHIYIHMSIYNMHTNVCILYIYIHIVLTGSIRKHRKTARLGNVSTAQKWDVTTNKHLEVESTIIPVVF